ncbi:MAG TPA: ABC transporter permease [Bryobacteraceae bacterium]|nr:ABC transporter permease [Bryobacteraceae bacterium]
MRVLTRATRLFSNLLRRDRVESTLDAELGAWVNALTDRFIAAGLSREEARRQALIETGGIEAIKENVRDARLGQSIETACQDVRHAFRSLRRAPGFSILIIVTLAVGIGASLTMFSLMRGVLWRPLPYPEPDRIVTIQVDARNVPSAGATRQELVGIRTSSRSFEQVATIDSSNATLQYAGEMEHVSAASVTDDFLPLLRVRPAIGRLLDSRLDAGAKHPLAVLISGELWRRRFAADPGVIGRAVRIDNIDMQVVGVLPAGLRLFLPPSVNNVEQIDVWLPDRNDPAIPYRGVPLIARLRPGVTLDHANAELQVLAGQFARDYPDRYTGANAWQASPFDRGSGLGASFTARSLHDDMTRDIRPSLILLTCAVVFVLLIAYVNAANLTLVRGAMRRRELEIRRALGARTFRVVRQLISESLLLSLVSGAIGLVGAHVGLQAIRLLSASYIPLRSRMEIDAPVAIFALVLSALTSVLFGLVPAWRLASERSDHRLRVGRTQTMGSDTRKIQRAFVVAEVALSIAPLVCAGLMLRSFVNLMHLPLGFDPAGVVTARLPLDTTKYPNVEQRWAVLRNVVDRLRVVPEIKAVSAADPLPLAYQTRRRVGRPDQPDVPPILATQQFALPGYLRAIGTPLLEGRDFSDSDIREQRNVTIIDAGLAKRLWPEGPIGRVLSVYRTGWRNDMEIIGVTGNVRVTRVRDESIPHFMLPYGAYPSSMSLVVKTEAPADRIGPLIQSAVGAAHSERAAFEIRPMGDYVSESIGDTRFILFVLAAFAASSVVLAAVGLYGTLAYLTAQRTREFGIRLALGSSVKALVTIVIREGIVLVGAGAGIGLIGIAAISRGIRELLYGVHPFDGLTLSAVSVLLAIVALAAAGVPAYRAARIDPQTSLRCE